MLAPVNSNVMYPVDDRKTAKLGDRIIAAAIAAACGYFFGGMLGYLAIRVFEQTFGLVWISTIGFAIFGFFAPTKSRDLWSWIWTKVLHFLRKLMDTRRFYR